MVNYTIESNGSILSKYSVGDTVSWFCNDDGKIHTAKVSCVNKAMTSTGPEINYEIYDYLFGEVKTFFVDEYDVLEDYID